MTIRTASRFAPRSRTISNTKNENDIARYRLRSIRKPESQTSPRPRRTTHSVDYTVTRKQITSSGIRSIPTVSRTMRRR